MEVTKDSYPVMYEFGHKAYFDGAMWKYFDNDVPIDDEQRACPKCNKYSTKQGHDPCIANLPGVEYACCGHGIEDESYIKFIDGRIVRGTFELEEY